MKGNERNGYTFMRQWFDFAYQHPDKITPTHAALYFWLIQLNNSLDWKLKFGVPTVHTMEVLGIKSYKTYRKAFDELKSWGFIELVTKSTNQHTANVIALVKFTQADTKASPKQLPKQDDIDKPIETIETIETLETPKAGLISKIVELYFQVDSGAVNTDPDQSLKAATRFLEIFEKESPGLGADDALAAMRQFFENCLSISDNWLRPQMSLPIIVKYFNRIKKTLEQPSSHGATNLEIATIIAKRFGSNSPGKSVNADWYNDNSKPGTSPDLGKVDTENYLNEQ